MNTARFRLATDTVVGSFPFAVAQVTPVSYGVRPFVASRALVRTQADLAGTYNRLGINLTATTGDSSITRVQIANGGAMPTCAMITGIYRIDNCPAASLADLHRVGRPDRRHLAYVSG